MPAEHAEHMRSAVAVQPVICWPAKQPVVQGVHCPVELLLYCPVPHD